MHGLGPETAPDGTVLGEDARTLGWLGHLQRLASAGLLTGGIGHDLRNLLFPLQDLADRALSTDDPEAWRKALVLHRQHAGRAVEFLDVLMDFVKRDQRERAPVPVEAVVEDALMLLESTFLAEGIAVVRRFDGRHDALVDRTRLLQALVNLIGNALRAACTAGSTVEVRVRGQRQWVVVEVEDDGPGVPEDLRERIFQPFVRGDGGKRSGEAETPPSLPRRTGLGLFVTKHLIEEQGGSVDFESKTGRGALFRLRLEPAPRKSRPADASGVLDA